MDNDPKPDLFVKCLRFACGFPFGGVVAWFMIAQEVPALSGVMWAGVAGVAVITGFLAMHCGDEFWRQVFHWDRH